MARAKTSVRPLARPHPFHKRKQETVGNALRKEGTLKTCNTRSAPAAKAAIEAVTAATAAMAGLVVIHQLEARWARLELVVLMLNINEFSPTPDGNLSMSDGTCKQYTFRAPRIFAARVSLAQGFRQEARRTFRVHFFVCPLKKVSSSAHPMQSYLTQMLQPLPQPDHGTTTATALRTTSRTVRSCGRTVSTDRLLDQGFHDGRK